MSLTTFKKIQYPWALSLDKLDTAFTQLIHELDDPSQLTEEAVKFRYTELKGSFRPIDEPEKSPEAKVAPKKAVKPKGVKGPKKQV